ncbi:MAG: ATP-binding protein [Deltaproteobacteria bacterium]|nr:ATP-binding protein [Deltaproteobacteria bacterium]
MKYIKRWLETRLEDTLNSHPVIVLTGQRQVGKSTLLQQAGFLKDWRYITLDDPDILEQAKEDPKGLFLADKPTIVDEVQRCPELLVTIKYLVDHTNRRRNFILSGSGNISLRRAPRETLAGRAIYLQLTGFSHREMRELSPRGTFCRLWNGEQIEDSLITENLNPTASIWRGSLPGIALAPDDKIALDRMSGYVDTYIRKDIQDLVKIRHPQHFRRLMEALAQATGWPSVQDELSNDCGETRTNVSRYISLLKETKLVFDLKGYAVKSERAYKQSKYYWFDSGSACFLAGIYSPSELRQPHVRGRYLENFILQQIMSWASLQVIEPEIYYWRPKNQDAEIDFIILSGRQGIAVEVKASEKLSFGDTRKMREFLKYHPDISMGVIVYTGDRTYPAASNVYAVPWSVF